MMHLTNIVSVKHISKDVDATWRKILECSCGESRWTIVCQSTKIIYTITVSMKFVSE